MSFLKSDKKVFWILFGIYFIVNIPLLLNFNGIYWDDWTLVNMPFEGIHSQFSQNGGSAGILISTLHYTLVNVFGVFSYRILTVIMLFASGWFVFKTLNTIDQFSKKDSFFIALLFLLAPLYSAKIALIDFPYTFFSFFFFLSFYLLASKKAMLSNIPFRVSILVLFFLSFLINSLLFFYAIVLIYILYQNYGLKVLNIQNIRGFIKKYFDFLLLPILFFIVKKIWFNPYGLYEGYNSMNPLQALNYKSYYVTFYKSFVEPISQSFSTISFVIPALIVGFVFLLLYFVWKNKDNQIYSTQAQNNSSTQIVLMLSLGFLFFWFGAFPYMVVGKIPEGYSFSSRFQLLLPLGFAFILYYLIKLIVLDKFQKVFLALFVIAFMGYHTKEQIKWNVEWFYTQAIMEHMASSDEIKNNTTFLLHKDSIVHAKNIYSSYALNGMAKKVYEEDSRFFATQLEQLDQYKKYCPYINYNCSNWEIKDVVNLYLSESESNGFTKGKKSYIKTFLKLKYFELFDSSKFRVIVKDLVELEVR